MPGFSLSHLSALEIPPAALVGLAADAGFSAVGLRLAPAAPGAVCYPLAGGSPELRETVRRLAETGLGVWDVEFVPILPEIDVAALAPMLESAAALGARRLNVSGDDPDAARLADNFARICELAASVGLGVDLEFMRWREVGTLARAHEIVRRAGAPNGAILIDALHLQRSGGRPADLAAIAPTLVASLQLCDAPAEAPPEDAIIEEARERRLAPGAGALPLAALLAALPADIACGVEAPMRRPEGVSALAHLTHLRVAAEQVIAGVRAARPG